MKIYPGFLCQMVTALAILAAGKRNQGALPGAERAYALNRNLFF
jgi:hypothetical protein